MIIVEGPDGSGKTTLARRIAAELDLEYRRNPHISSSKGSTSAVGADWADEQIRTNDGGGVYDRFWYISEPMYQLVQQRSLYVDGDRLSRGTIDLANVDPVIVFCLPPWEISREIIRSQPEKLVGASLDQLEKVHWAYHGVYASWSNALYELVLTRDFTKEPDAFNLVQHRLRSLVDRRSQNRG